MTARRRERTPIFDEPMPAVDVLAHATGLAPDAARDGLLALIRAGYVIGPRDPTNAMLLAYMQSYGQEATNPATVITAIAKARRRWRAMGDKGSAMAVSRKRTKSVL